MTWFLKTIVFCGSLLLLAFVLGVLGNTLSMCKRNCKDEPDDHLCSRRWDKTDGAPNGKPFARYTWLRNECEMKCLMDGANDRVEMEPCTSIGQNHSIYRCDDYARHKQLLQRCMRNESMDF